MIPCEFGLADYFIFRGWFLKGCSYHSSSLSFDSAIRSVYNRLYCTVHIGRLPSYGVIIPVAIGWGSPSLLTGFVTDSVFSQSLCRPPASTLGLGSHQSGIGSRSSPRESGYNGLVSSGLSSGGLDIRFRSGASFSLSLRQRSSSVVIIIGRLQNRIVYSPGGSAQLA